MSNAPTGQPPTGVVQVSTTNSNLPLTSQPQLHSYKSVLNPSLQHNKPTASAPIFDLHHGEPSFLWEDKDVENMVMSEDLQFAVVGKFAYGMPEFQELKKQIPLQLELKGTCCIGLLDPRHILIKLSILEDYIHLLARPAFYLKIGSTLHQMRGLKYEVWFDPNEETSIGVAWVSFPGLPPVFFGKETVFSLARAIGRPLQVDAATRAKSRPSCAKVKVELDLLASRPQRVRIGIKKSTTGEAKFKWVRIRYDYVPKYCRECRLQGHCESECYVLHPELLQKNDLEGLKDATVCEEPVKILKSGKIVGNVHSGDVDPTQPTQKNGDGNLVAAYPSRGISKRNGGRVLHPNKNTSAWVRVDNKKKQTQEPARQVEGAPSTSTKRVNQEETITTRNAFDILEKDVTLQVVQGKDGNLQQQSASIDVQQEKDIQTTLDVQDKQVGTAFIPTSMEDANLVANQRGSETKKWVELAFKNHPKVSEVGVSSVSGSKAGSFAPPLAPRSGTDFNVAQPTVTAEGHEPVKHVKVAACLDKLVALIAEESRGDFIDDVKHPVGLKEDVSQDCEAAREGETLSFKDSEGLGVGGAFISPACSAFNDSQQLSQSRLHEHEDAMFLLDKDCSPSLINNAQISGKSRGELMFDEQHSVLFPSVYGNSCASKKADILIDEESRGQPSAFHTNRIDAPSALIPNEHGNPCGNMKVSNKALNAPSLINNAFSAVESRDAECRVESRDAQNLCGIKRMSGVLIDGEACGDVETCADSRVNGNTINEVDSRGIVETKLPREGEVNNVGAVGFNSLSCEGDFQQPSASLNVYDVDKQPSVNGIDAAFGIEAVGSRGNILVNEALNDMKSGGEVEDSQVVEVEGIFNTEVEFKRGDFDPSAAASSGCVDFNSLSLDIETPPGIKVMTDAACLGNNFNAQTTPVEGKGYEVINDVQGGVNVYTVVGDSLKALRFVDARQSGGLINFSLGEAAFNRADILSPKELMQAAPQLSEELEREDVSFNQEFCVQNKQVHSIPSIEESTDLESMSVAKPILLEKNLIPTDHLEWLCKSVSPSFGNSFLNINAPSFVPKSFMQLVPHSKCLPTDDELVKRMDLYDTRGILARQGESFQERYLQGHYLVEHDDLFEEEEFDEESTAHNFSMVAREGDLSPREIRDNAPKRMSRVRRPLEPTRVQPSRSTISKSKRSKKSKK